MATSADAMHAEMDAAKAVEVVVEPKAEVSWSEWKPGPTTKLSSKASRNRARKKNNFQRAKRQYEKRNPV